MTHTYCMTPHCALAERCTRYEADPGKHLLNHIYADFSEELVHQPDSMTTCPLFMNRNDPADEQARLH